VLKESKKEVALMFKSNRFAQVIIGTLAAAVFAVVVVGCGGGQEQETTPPPEPAPPPPQQTVAPPPPQQPPGEPTYRPTTEEWVQLPVRILYPSGGSRLDDQARAVIREGHASMVHRTDIVRVRVEGHADGRGTTDANQQLGMERAQGVVDFMVGDLGMPRELFEVVSYGDERPLTSESSAPDRLQNRRVEFSILVRRQAAP
jgi:outer membrane protein OmpA-like peptidoglycan-associated protein